MQIITAYVIISYSHHKKGQCKYKTLEQTWKIIVAYGFEKYFNYICKRFVTKYVNSKCVFLYIIFVARVAFIGYLVPHPFYKLF